MTQNCLNDTQNSNIDKTSFFWEKKLLKEINTPHQNLQCTFEVEQGGIILFLKSGSVNQQKFSSQGDSKKESVPPSNNGKIKKDYQK